MLCSANRALECDHDARELAREILSYSKKDSKDHLIFYELIAAIETFRKSELEFIAGDNSII